MGTSWGGPRDVRSGHGIERQPSAGGLRQSRLLGHRRGGGGVGWWRHLQLVAAGRSALTHKALAGYLLLLVLALLGREP